MDNKLSCSAHKCVYNMKGLCSAHSIDVAGKSAHTSSATECDTFSERGVRSTITGLTNMNIKGEVKQVFNGKDIEMNPTVKCSAINCIHNIDNYCSASNVVIDGTGAVSQEATQCDTFRE